MFLAPMGVDLGVSREAGSPSLYLDASVPLCIKNVLCWVSQAPYSPFPGSLSRSLALCL